MYLPIAWPSWSNRMYPRKHEVCDGEAHAVDTPEQLLRTQEVAAWLAVSKTTLVRWRQSLQGPAVYWLADGVPRYRVADVEQWLAARSAGGPGPCGGWVPRLVAVRSGRAG